ncbi:MAG TPA: acylneuraminate cytidylyltransferase family protein [Bacteroidetes bacterium]|nr:acylneuraminate cytidylyltransferase family protein [Bacteroidota bacterium]
MPQDKEILALVPARSGSRGIKDKNILRIVDKTVLDYTVEAGLSATMTDRVIVSTDSPLYRDIALSAGAEAPFLRPVELALDTTPSIDVIIHALKWLADKESYSPDILVLLQPTTPLRDGRHVDEAINRMLDSGADSVVSLVASQRCLYRLCELDEDGRVRILKHTDYVRRQEVPMIYRENGAIYASYADRILDQKKLLGERIAGYIMSERDSIDIDTDLDLKLLKILLSERRQNSGEKWK